MVILKKNRNNIKRSLSEKGISSTYNFNDIIDNNLLKYGFTKIKGSSLIETMIATVLIVIIFIVASLTLNNLFNNTIKYDTTSIEIYINKLEYQYQHQLLKLPYEEIYGGWELSISPEIQSELPVILIEANHLENKRTLKRIIPF